MDTNAALLDDILTAFRHEGVAPTPGVVGDWCRRFPQFADAIEQEAMSWAEEEVTAALHRTAPEDEGRVEHIRLRALAAVAAGSLGDGR